MFGGPLRPFVKKHVEGNVFYKLLGKLGVSPDFFTWLEIPWSLLAAYFIYADNIPLALPFVFLAMVWDGIDGAYARTLNKTTVVGAYVEGVLDLYVEIIVMLGIIAWKYPFEGALFICLSLILSYSKPRVAMFINTDNRDWPSIGEKFERRLLLGLTMIVYCFMPSFKFYGYEIDVFSVSLYLMSLMVFVGGIQRMLYAVNMIRDKGLK